MKKIALILIATVFLSACTSSMEGNGNAVEQVRESSPFHSIDIEGNYEIFLHPDTYSSVKIKADDNLLPHIITEVKRGVLHVSSEYNFSNYESLELHIRVKDLQSIEIGGACNLKGYDTFVSDKIDISLGGAIELAMEVECKELEVEMGGACTVNLKGIADKLSLEGGGSCNFFAEKLISKKCEVSMGGSGEVRVYATDELDIEVAGSVDVYYAGKPKKLTQETAGASSVVAL